MGNWSKLKADEKVRVIKFARLNGVSDIKTIRDTFNMYADGGYNINGVSQAYTRNGNIQPNYNVTSYAGNVNNNKIYTFNSNINGVTNSESTVVTPEFANVQLGDNARTFSVETPEYSYYNDRVKDIQSYNTSPGNILPEVTVTPNGNYMHTQYANGGNLVHKYDGELVGLSLELNNTIVPQPITIFELEIPVQPITITDKMKDDYQSLIHRNAWDAAENQFNENNVFKTSYDDFKKLFFNIYGELPDTLLNSQQYLDSYVNDGDLMSLEWTLPTMRNHYTKLAANNVDLQNLVNNFNWDYVNTLMNANKDTTDIMARYKSLIDNTLSGLQYYSDYYNSPGFKERLNHFGLHLLYKNQITPLESIISTVKEISFDPSVNNAYSSFLFGLDYNGEFANYGTGAHEAAHHNTVYNTRRDSRHAYAPYDSNSLYYSPYYENDYTRIPTSILTILKPSNYTDKHDAEINESYSDLVRTRALLEKLGIYKSTEAGQVFTEDLYDLYLNTEEGKNDRFLLLHNKQQVIDALNLIASNTNTTNPFETSNGTYLAALGGPLTHKKSTGGPLYPFSFEKNPFFKTPIVRYNEGGFLAKLFGKKDTSPTPEEIKADRVERFINDTWETEYSVPRGYDPTTGLFYPYKSPEGGTRTIGPGFKLRKDGSGDNTMFSAKEAAKGVTREQINEKLRAQGELLYDKVLEFLNQKGNRLPVDTINPNIMNGLMDLRFLVGALGGWDNLREAVLNGDLEGIKKESLVTFKDGNTGKIKPDARRNELRAEKFWHYD